jgi:hypothetical protein
MVATAWPESLRPTLSAIPWGDLALRLGEVPSAASRLPRPRQLVRGCLVITPKYRYGPHLASIMGRLAGCAPADRIRAGRSERFREPRSIPEELDEPRADLPCLAHR